MRAQKLSQTLLKKYESDEWNEYEEKAKNESVGQKKIPRSSSFRLSMLSSSKAIIAVFLSCTYIIIIT